MGCLLCRRVPRVSDPPGGGGISSVVTQCPPFPPAPTNCWLEAPLGGGLAGDFFGGYPSYMPPQKCPPQREGTRATRATCRLVTSPRLQY